MIEMYLNGASLREVGRAVGLSATTVWRQLSRVNVVSKAVLLR